MSTYRNRAKSCAVLVALASTSPVQANDASQKIAVCPWEMGPKVRRAADALRRFSDEQAQATLEVIPPSDIKASLSDTPCESTVESLAPLAVRTHAAYGLYVRADEATERLVLRWMLVSREGQVTSGGDGEQTFSFPLGAREGQGTLEESVRRFYTGAVLPRLSPVVAKEEEAGSEDLLSPLVRGPLGGPAAPVASTRPLYTEPQSQPAVDLTAAAPKQHRSALTTWEWVGVGTAGAGAAALLTSGVLALSTKKDRRTLYEGLDAEGRASRSPESWVLLRSVQQRSKLVNATLIGGAGLLVAGSLMYWIAPRREASVDASVTAGPSGGALQLQGRF